LRDSLFYYHFPIWFQRALKLLNPNSDETARSFCVCYLIDRFTGRNSLSSDERINKKNKTTKMVIIKKIIVRTFLFIGYENVRKSTNLYLFSWKIEIVYGFIRDKREFSKLNAD
jgi:hypothetical protein